tara:strand:+ start:2711 stop:3091 length:381 start_codon:yes stop_codon:yes gene_type:complete
MKKEFNVKGTKFTVNVDVQTEDFYETIPTDYKKILYLLGQVSSIGAKIDKEFTMRNFLIDKKEFLIENHKKWGSDWEEVEEDLEQNNCLEVGPELKLSTAQKNTILDTIDSTMGWYLSLRGTIKNL